MSIVLKSGSLNLLEPSGPLQACNGIALPLPLPLLLLLCYVPFWVFFFVVLFCVLFVCTSVLYYCHRVSTKLLLTNISYHFVTPAKSQSFCLANQRNSGTYYDQLSQSHDYSYCVNRRKLAPPPPSQLLRLHKRTDLRVHKFANSPDL